MKVLVLGGGFAGLAAAIRLQERRHDVVLIERRGVLGGRATSTRDAITGDTVDNGTHVMLGAYHATFELARRAGVEDLLRRQPSLRLDYVDAAGASRLACPAVVAPLHLTLGLLGLRVPWGVRVQALRLGWALGRGALPRGLTLAEYFARHGQGSEVRRLLWDPLATAILNETPERGDAGLFVEAVRRAFLRRAEDSALVFLRVGLGAFAERLARYFEARGGIVRRRTLVERIESNDGRACRVHCRARPVTREDIVAGARAERQCLEADAIVCAVPWNAVGSMVGEPWGREAPFAGLSELGASPILSVELWLDRAVLDGEMIGLRDSEMEWVFDKGRLHGRLGPPQYLSFIVSAARRSGPHRNAELVAAAEEALRRYFPRMREARVVRSLVRREPEATFSCVPGNEALRPGTVTPIAGLYLAGDWTNTGLPATIEGAVLSGFRAADAIAPPHAE